MVIFTESAPAKVNFALDILGKRNDGYHELKMINHEVKLADELSFSDSDKIELICDDADVPVGEENLIIRAVLLLKKKYGINRGARIYLNKTIPMQAGLGGGSADAAATIRGLKRLWNLELNEEEMCDFGAQIGADVPYCIGGGTALVEGYGERITRLKSFPEFRVLVVKPDISISTSVAFKMTDHWQGLKHLDIGTLAQKINNEEWADACNLAGNSFEAPIFNEWPEIKAIKEKSNQNGALYSTMSGSGSTIVAYFKDQVSAQKAALAFKDDSVYVTLTEVWNNRG